MEKPSKTARQLLEGKRVGLTRVVTVAPDSSVLAALQIMAEEDVGAVVVCQNGRLVGIMSERDCARKIELHGKTARDTLVREIMTEDVIYVTPADSVDKCRMLMSKHRIRHLPVCDSGEVIGVLSSRDVLEEIISEEEHLIHDLETERLVMTTNPGVY
jgi:CBS domain-containing protein